MKKIELQTILEKVTYKSPKIPSKDYQTYGKYPIIAQDADKFISGYTNESNPITENPLIIFGDHSCSLKYVNFPFFRGADGTQVLKINSEHNSRFIYYSILSVIEQLPNYQKYERHFKYLKEMIIPTFDLPTQTQIAAILSSLDDKIELNNRIASVLERMMREIYDYWFVQFDFPDENGKPYQSNGGKMTYNPQLKRNIPQGWEVKKLGDLCSLMNGVNYNKEDLGDKKYKIVNVRNITASSLLLDDSNFDAINLKSTLADKYLIENNDILIARSGTPGAVRILPYANNDTIFCGFIIRCKPNDIVYKNYLTYSLKMLEGTNAMVTGGSILKNVSQETLKRNYILLPKNNLLDKFNTITNTIIKEMEYTTKQTQTLTALRDFLLPLLMNGQASVQ